MRTERAGALGGGGWAPAPYARHIRGISACLCRAGSRCSRWVGALPSRPERGWGCGGKFLFMRWDAVIKRWKTTRVDRSRSRAPRRRALASSSSPQRRSQIARRSLRLTAQSKVGDSGQLGLNDESGAAGDGTRLGSGIATDASEVRACCRPLSRPQSQPSLADPTSPDRLPGVSSGRWRRYRRVLELVAGLLD